MRTFEYDQINWMDERGMAYGQAKKSPGELVQFQSELGYSVVYYKPGTPAEEIMGVKMSGTDGYWFEKPVLDKTKMNPDANDIGFRVRDKGERDAA